MNSVIAPLAMLLGAAAAAQDRPNVVLIMADDLGYECLSCYGSESYETPNLDALAGRGVRFTHCYSQPLCTPSRVKLMTGRSNIRNYSHFSVLERTETTIGQMFRRAGYATCVAGKWQLLGAEHYGRLAGTGTHPSDAGFDTYCLWQVSRLGSRYWGPLVERDGRLIQYGEDRYGPDVFTEFICDFIGEHRDEPFFVYYPMALVHNPFEPTPASPDRDAAGGPANFADMIAYMDRLVGRIVSRLDELGLRDNTVVMFTGDNGTGRAIRSRLGGRVIRGGKGLPTDAGTRVPLIVSAPALAPQGRVCGDLVDFSDFVPTLTQACGFEPPGGVIYDGRSFWPRVRGEPGEPREWIFCYYNPRPGQEGWHEVCFVRDQRWKLYRSGELYDVAGDVLEQRPITAGEGESAEARARLQRALDSMPASPALIRGANPEEDG